MSYHRISVHLDELDTAMTVQVDGSADMARCLVDLPGDVTMHGSPAQLRAIFARAAALLAEAPDDPELVEGEVIAIRVMPGQLSMLNSGDISDRLEAIADLGAAAANARPMSAA